MAQPMIALAIVAKLAYQAVTCSEQADEEILNNVAAAIAGWVDVFDCRPVQSGGEPILLASHEVRSGSFGGGGMTLDFNDGRPRKSNLCIGGKGGSRVHRQNGPTIKPPLMSAPQLEATRPPPAGAPFSSCLGGAEP